MFLSFYCLKKKCLTKFFEVWSPPLHFYVTFLKNKNMHPAVTFGQTTRIAYVLLMNNINFRPIPLNGMDLVITKSMYKNVFQEFVFCDIINRFILYYHH